MYAIFQLADPENNIIFPALSGYLYILWIQEDTEQ